MTEEYIVPNLDALNVFTNTATSESGAT